MKKLLFTAVATLGLASAMLAQVPNYVPTNGLVGWWPFNGNANDESGNGNNGTVNGAILAEDRFGLNNSAYEFDGVSNFIQVNDNQTLDLTNTYTLSAWVKIPDYSTNPSQVNTLGEVDDFRTILGKPRTSDWTTGYNLTTKPTGNDSKFYSAVQNQSCCPDIWIISQSDVKLNNWINVISVYDGANLRMYYNGILDSTLEAVYSLDNSAAPLFFGKEFVSVSYNWYRWFNGKIDDIGIWNRALSQEEITILYNAESCANNTFISPQTNAVSTGSTATFTASTSDPNPSYVWQSDLGQGFQTLSDVGNYSGTSSATLSLANVQVSEHNQPIRVISTSGECIDTSAVAILSILDTCITTIFDTTFVSVTDTLIINTLLTALTPPANINTIKVFPNPANTHISIDYGNFALMNGYQLRIENSLGQQVFQTNITQQSDFLSLATWGGNGLYFVHIVDPQGNTVDIRKIVLQ
ncbi:MAG: LamG-like jellyroll fold domain-containing protein [Bacteroidia bacterium]|jgi:hypothetical protein